MLRHYLLTTFVNRFLRGRETRRERDEFEGKGLVDTGKIEDVPATEAWARLAANTETVLIDVRTRAEWTFVGLPDLDTLNKRALTIEWQTFPEGRTDPDFVEKLDGLLEGAGATKSTELFFMCRSGARSRQAAEAMAEAGYTRCRNVSGGFEGPLDPSRKRGQVAGWKAAGLPWRQG